MFKKSIFIALFFTAIVFSSHFEAQNTPTEDILSLINAAREVENAPPLVANSQLIAAAQRHSNDMANTENLSHVGSDGSQFWQRIADAGYNMNTGAQNILSLSTDDITEAFSQWRDSPPHYANMVNPSYREIGVAVATSASGVHYFTMVLAARNNFTPTVESVNTDILPTLIPTQPVIEQPVLPTLTPTPVILQPTNTAFAPSATPVPPTFTQTPIRPTATVTNIVTVTPSPTALVSNTPTQTRIPPTNTPEPIVDLRLIYNTDSFTLLNASDRPLFIEGLSFENTVGGTEIDRWDTEFLTASLAEFPSGDCLQAWGLERFDILNSPDPCEQRHGWIAVNDASAFWRNAQTFIVYRFGEPITECVVSTGECLVNLTDRLQVTESTSTPAPQAEQASAPTQNTPPQDSNNWTAQIRLIYTSEQFTILNTSGSTLDLSGLSFGDVSITWWNTEFLSRPLSEFPSADCLEAWSITLEQWPAKSSECDIRHAWIGLTPEQVFWQEAFSVSYNGTALTTCPAAQSTCDFNLP